jgi:hypothetical protein
MAMREGKTVSTPGARGMQKRANLRPGHAALIAEVQKGKMPCDDASERNRPRRPRKVGRHGLGALLDLLVDVGRLHDLALSPENGPCRITFQALQSHVNRFESRQSSAKLTRTL